jgi:hypothetical protein
MSPKRNPLLPWYIGLAIIALADLWVAYRIFSTSCPAPGIIEAMVVIVLPAVYLVLMYLTFQSQSRSERT